MKDINHKINTNIEQILKSSKNIAIVGASQEELRPSYQVARYLQKAGYNIIPVNPKYSALLDTKCFPDLKSIDQKIDIVDIFRRPEHVMPVIEESIQIGAKTVWMQLGVFNPDAASFAVENGLQVVMDKCIKIEHLKFNL